MPSSPALPLSLSHLRLTSASFSHCDFPTTSTSSTQLLDTAAVWHRFCDDLPRRLSPIFTTTKSPLHITEGEIVGSVEWAKAGWYIWLSLHIWEGFLLEPLVIQFSSHPDIPVAQCCDCSCTLYLVYLNSFYCSHHLAVAVGLSSFTIQNILFAWSFVADQRIHFAEFTVIRSALTVCSDT